MFPADNDGAYEEGSIDMEKGSAEEESVEAVDSESWDPAVVVGPAVDDHSESDSDIMEKGRPEMLRIGDRDNSSAKSQFASNVQLPAIISF